MRRIMDKLRPLMDVPYLPTRMKVGNLYVCDGDVCHFFVTVRHLWPDKKSESTFTSFSKSRHSRVRNSTKVTTIIRDMDH